MGLKLIFCLLTVTQVKKHSKVLWLKCHKKALLNIFKTITTINENCYPEVELLSCTEEATEMAAKYLHKKKMCF